MYVKHIYFLVESNIPEPRIIVKTIKTDTKDELNQLFKNQSQYEKST